MMNKPYMDLEIEEGCVGNGYYLVQKASTILRQCGMRQESEDIMQAASVNGFEFYICLKLLKHYMEL